MSRTGISGIEQLDKMIARCNSLASGPEYAQAAKKATESFLASELGAGRDPNTGKAFPRSLRGEKTMQSAASRPTVRIAGTALIIVLAGHYVFHLFEKGRRVARRAIPQRGIPEKLGQAIRLGMVEPFRRKARGE